MPERGVLAYPRHGAGRVRAAGTWADRDHWCRTKPGQFDPRYPPHLGGLLGFRL